MIEQEDLLKKVQVGKDQEKAQSEKRFPLQKPRWEKNKLTIRYLYHRRVVVVRDRKIQTDCKQSLRIGKIRALNGCTRRLFRAATRHNHKNSDIKRYK